MQLIKKSKNKELFVKILFFLFQGYRRLIIKNVCVIFLTIKIVILSL